MSDLLISIASEGKGNGGISKEGKIIPNIKKKKEGVKLIYNIRVREGMKFIQQSQGVLGEW